jgi:hypothetical protein
MAAAAMPYARFFVMPITSVERGNEHVGTWKVARAFATEDFMAMSAITINKAACRAYGILFVLLGITVLLFGGLLIYSSVFGVPDRLPAWNLTGALATMDLKSQPFFGAGVACVIFAAIPISIGVFSYLGNVWTMIIGTLLWLVFCFPGPLFFFPGQVSGYGQFEIICSLVFVLLTILAVAFREHPAPTPAVI